MRENNKQADGFEDLLQFLPLALPKVDKEEGNRDVFVVANGFFDLSGLLVTVLEDTVPVENLLDTDCNKGVYPSKGGRVSQQW